jgi:hypothetical protein
MKSKTNKSKPSINTLRFIVKVKENSAVIHQTGINSGAKRGKTKTLYSNMIIKYKIKSLFCLFFLYLFSILAL